MAAATLLTLGASGVSAASASAPTRCTGPEGPVTIKGEVIAGPGCNLSETTAEGNVTVEPGGSLITEPGTTTVVTGNVRSNKAAEIRLEGNTSIGGNVQLTATTERIVIFSGTVKGNLHVTSGIADLIVLGETVDGNLQARNNSGGFSGGLVEILASNVVGNLQVANNTPAGSSVNVVAVDFTSVAGSIQVHNNSATSGSFDNLVEVFGNNPVRNNLEVNNNIAGPPGEIVVAENTITNNLQCQGNKPLPNDLGAPNTAGQKRGQCRQL